MAGPDIYTFLDVIEQLNDWRGGGANAVEDRKIVRATLSAYRHIVGAHDWKALTREFSIVTNASYNTGTIAYTHSSRTITLTSGTFPSWAADGEIRISSVSYPVSERTDATTLVLSSESNPGDDVASGTSYTLFQTGYRLPVGFQAMTPPVESTLQGGLTPVPAGAIIEWRTGSYTLGEPNCFAIISDRENTIGSRKKIVFWPVPITQRQYRAKIKIRPAQIQHTGVAEKFYQGTITGSSGGTSITGSGTAFESSWEGAVLRIGPDGTNRPTGIDGSYPYAEQHVIDTYSSATSLSITSELIDSYSGRKYVISDPIDIDDVMLEPFLARCKYAASLEFNDSASVKQSLLQEYLESLEVAIEMDCSRLWDAGSNHRPALLIPPAEYTT